MNPEAHLGCPISRMGQVKVCRVVVKGKQGSNLGFRARNSANRQVNVLQTIGEEEVPRTLFVWIRF